jgi:signal transduction histidine kinase
VSTAASFAGWIAAGIAGGVVVVSRRTLQTRMEAVARACHELRGPLAAARLGLALGCRGGELSAARLRAIDIELGRAALALDDLAQARSAALRPRELERVDLRELLVDSVEAWQGSAEAAGVSLRVGAGDGGAVVWGDRLRLAQAAENLIANAIEHGGANVAARGLVGDGVIRLEISDDGPGLPAPVAELTRGARRGRGARGRGLAIAAAIAQGHGGRLAAAPAPTGARLALELPPAPAGDARRNSG